MGYQSSQLPHDLWDIVETVEFDIGEKSTLSIITLIFLNVDSKVLSCVAVYLNLAYA